MGLFSGAKDYATNKIGGMGEAAKLDRVDRRLDTKQKNAELMKSRAETRELLASAEEKKNKGKAALISAVGIPLAIGVAGIAGSKVLSQGFESGMQNLGSQMAGNLGGLVNVAGNTINANVESPTVSLTP